LILFHIFLFYLFTHCVLRHRVKHQPAYYLDGLLAHIEAIERQQRKREKKKRLSAGVEPADALLRGLEISLRTNTLECVAVWHTNCDLCFWRRVFPTRACYVSCSFYVYLCILIVLFIMDQMDRRLLALPARRHEGPVRKHRRAYQPLRARALRLLM
jgi:hypothetical protein